VRERKRRVWKTAEGSSAKACWVGKGILDIKTRILAPPERHSSSAAALSLSLSSWSVSRAAGSRVYVCEREKERETDSGHRKKERFGVDSRPVDVAWKMTRDIFCCVM